MAVNNTVIQNPKRKGLSTLTEVQRYGRQLEDVQRNQPNSKYNRDYKDYELRQRPWHQNTKNAVGKGLAKAGESAVNFLPDLAGADQRWATFSDYIDDNPHSTQFQVVEDLVQLTAGLVGGSPIRKAIQKSFKGGHKYLRDRQVRKSSKRGKASLRKGMDIATEGALAGGIAEMLAFRGQDEHLMMEEFFDYHPEWKKAYDEVTREQNWEDKSTTELSFSFQNSLRNMLGRSMFAMEGAAMGAAANFLIASGKAARLRYKDHKINKAGQGADLAGETAADATAAKGKTGARIDEIRAKQEAAAFREVTEARDELDRVAADGAEVEGKAKPTNEELGRDTDIMPDEVDATYIKGDVTNAEGLKPEMFEQAPLVREDTKFKTRLVDPDPTTLRSTDGHVTGTKVRITDDNVIQVDRSSIQTEYVASQEGKRLSSDTSFTASDVFDNALEYERYLIEREKAKLFFPKLVRESAEAYTERLEKHAANEAKRRGLGNFYKYEFNAPKHLKHLELTEADKLKVIFKEGVDHTQVKRIVKMLTGDVAGVGPARILKEAEELFRLDTATSDSGLKYFQGRLMHFFMDGLRDQVKNIKDTTTMAKAVGYLHDPQGSTLVEVMREHFLDNLDELADSHGIDSRAMMHRLMKGRGTAKHFYGNMDTEKIRAKGILQDEDALKEMNVRVLAYRMEQVIGMKRFRALTKQMAELSPDELKGNPIAQQYIIEMERQAEKIKTMQKLRESSGRVLRAWRDFNDPSMAQAQAGAAMDGKNLAGLHQHAKRTDAIIDGADNLLDATAGASDALVKRTSLMDIHNEYWINSILSGTKTQVVNTLSTGLHMYYKPMEGIIGSIKDPQARGAMIKTLVETAMINVQVTRVLAKLGINKIARKTGLRSNTKYLNRRKEIYRGKGGAATDTYEQAVGAVAGARKSFRTAEGSLTKGADLFDNFPIGTISRNALSENSSEVAKETIDYLGNMIRIPSRIMIGTDELFKQISFRASVMGKLSSDAVDVAVGQNIKPSTEFISKFVGEHFHGMIRSNGKRHNRKNILEEGKREYKKRVKQSEENLVPFEVTEEDFVTQHVDKHWSDTKEKASDYGMHWAEDTTFTRRLDADLTELQDLGKVSKKATAFTQDMQDLVNKHPWMRLIMPFIKTPVNILKWPMQRMPFVMSPKGTVMGHEFEWVKNLHLRYQADMASQNPLRAAQAKGRLYAGRFYWTSLLFAASTGTITGAGPSNPRERRNWMATGKRPYSVHVGDKYISYSRLDPFALPLGLAADLYEKGQRLLQDGDVDDNWMTSTLLAGAYSMSNNMADKSYLAGINNVLQALIDPDNEFEDLLKRQGTSYIPRIFSQWTPITDDHYMKKTYGILEGITSRIPGAAKNIEPMRNYMGEPMEAMYAPSVWASGINPFMVSQAKHDPVLEELADIGYGFGPPSPKIKGSRYLDMRKFHNPDKNNQSAFDRYQELIGQIKTRGGKGLRQALEDLFQTEEYHRASLRAENDTLFFKNTYRDPRVKWIKAIMYKYRMAAKSQTLKEYPELMNAVRAFDATVNNQLIELIKT